eukprot:TRINITY_DN30205_c0_g1_i2.p1 TRINITY_DN30205_c0_g1~~TRINITY_DN30205_c0_g1_i2.p1  ORF type:complete len:163 (+),score=30.03 TRINITY_DN30205_c0_g1_i2:94-582(+)
MIALHSAGLPSQWDLSRCATRELRSPVHDQLKASMRMGSQRLRGPRQQGMTLKERALSRSGSSPLLGPSGSPGGRREEAATLEMPDALSRAMKDFVASGGKIERTVNALQAYGNKLGEIDAPHLYEQHQRPQGVGRWKYAIPEHAVDIMKSFNKPKYLQKPL